MSDMSAVEEYLPDDEALRRILEGSKTIVVVGLSPKPHRDSHAVAKYLQERGYRIIPVNPKGGDVLGEHCYASLADIPGDVEIDVVDVFRRAEETPPVARAAVERGAKVLWLQLGIVNDEAREIAESAGLEVVMGACMKIEHRRLEGDR
jgi:predicted CoA-binding protein